MFLIKSEHTTHSIYLDIYVAETLNHRLTFINLKKYLKKKNYGCLSWF